MLKISSKNLIRSALDVGVSQLLNLLIAFCSHTVKFVEFVTSKRLATSKKITQITKNLIRTTGVLFDFTPVFSPCLFFG